MKIKIHNSTYIFLLLSFLSGYFEYIYLLLIVIFVHELGHFIFGLFCGISVSYIIIYPFGGITYFESDLNIKIYKEFICLIGGIIFQLLFLIFIKLLYINNIVTFHVYNLIYEINVLLISFNFLPIIPLDGGKLLNLFFDNFFSYKCSFIVSIVISFIFIIIFFLFNKTIFSIILCIFLFKSVICEYKNINYKFNKFLIERYLNNYKFNKTKIIYNISDMKRDCYHVISNEFEEKVLIKLFEVL